MQKEDEALLKDEYARYLALNPNEKKQEDAKIDKSWNNVYEDFMELCDKDEELAKVYDELKKIEDIMSFNIKDHFTVYSHTVNAFDPEGSRDIYEFSQKKFDEAKALSENWDEEEKRLKAKIEEAKNAKFILFREKKIAKLEKELKLKKDIVDYYRNCLRKQELKEHYLKHHDKLVAPLKEKYNSILQDYAQKTLEKHIKINPNIICVKHNSFISSTGHKRSYDMTVLNNLSNSIGESIRKSLVNTSKR